MSELLIQVGERRVAARPQPTRHARGTVVFVHGSGVDRHDERNQFVADTLRQAGFAAVLLDLLEPYEARQDHHAFDVELQADRLARALDSLRAGRKLVVPLGIFATGIGAGVALLAAARRPAEVAAVVARSGRPDAALRSLHRVKSPTLLIVDEPDSCNRQALERLAVDKELVVVPSRSHFFASPSRSKAWPPKRCAGSRATWARLQRATRTAWPAARIRAR